MKNKLFYQFVLVLKNLDENTPNLEDSLYEAGCSDALINFRNGTVYLDFDRCASSLEEAVMSAIKDVESASINAIVANVAPEDWVTESEIAKRLDSTRQAVSLWIKGVRRKLNPFPRPIMKISEKSPLWKWCEVVEWLYENEIIKEKDIVKNAIFIQTINIVLDERNSKNRDRKILFNKLLSQNNSIHKGNLN